MSRSVSGIDAFPSVSHGTPRWLSGKRDLIEQPPLSGESEPLVQRVPLRS